MSWRNDSSIPQKMVFLEEGRANSQTLPGAFRGREKCVLSISGQFQHHVRICLEQICRPWTHVLHPETLRLRGKENWLRVSLPASPCQHSSVGSAVPTATVSLFSLHWISSRVKNQNMMRNIHSPFLEKNLHLHGHMGLKSCNLSS